MNFSGLPDNYKPGTRGQAPDVASNNIFGFSDERPNYDARNANMRQVNHQVNPEQQASMNAQMQNAHERATMEAMANKQHGMKKSNIFDQSGPDDFSRDNPYIRQYQPRQTSNVFTEPPHETMRNQHMNQNQNNQQRSNVFSNDQHEDMNRQKSGKRVQQRGRQGFNPITGEDYTD